MENYLILGAKPSCVVVSIWKQKRRSLTAFTDLLIESVYKISVYKLLYCFPPQTNLFKYEFLQFNSSTRITAVQNVFYVNLFEW